MDLYSYVIESALILIPVLGVIGQIIKGIEKIPNKYIPLILLPFGILGSLGLGGLNIDSVIQGVLVTGTSVYGHQVYKQLTIDKEQ